MQNSKVYKLFIILLLYSCAFSQEKIGYVTYQSSQFIYVKFDNTEGININDTLYVKKENTYTPVLTSSYVSTRSCACSSIGNPLLKAGDKVIAKIKENSAYKMAIEPENNNNNSDQGSTSRLSVSGSKQRKQDLLLRDKFKLSVQSYSTLSNVRGYTNQQQWRYLISSELYQIGNVPLSFSTYLTYRQRPGELGRNSFSKSINVYELSFKYNFTKDFNLILGRNINQCISNISSIDGIQFNKNWSKTAAGIVLGSRPDLNYSSGLNFKLFETGIYIARTDSVLRGTIDNTLALFEQTNSLKTDRRFIYFQHSNSIFNNLYAFLSAEIDLYARDKGKAENVFNLMNLYLLSRYSINKNLSLSLSYDNRKNIIYYETYKNGLDSLIDRETRQGIRAGVDFHPLKQVFITVSGGYNFKKGDPKPARNLISGISLINIPVIRINTNFNFTTFVNSFLFGNIYGVNFSKEIFGGNLYPSIGYRRSEYKIKYSGKSFQNFLSTDLSVRLINQIYISTNYELELERNMNFHRLLIDISTRL